MFVAEKAKEKQKEVVVVTTKAVKCSHDLFLDKDHNTDPMVVVNVDQKEQFVVFKNVKFLCELCQRLVFNEGADCQMNCKMCREKQILCLEFLVSFSNTLFVPLLKSPEAQVCQGIVQLFFFVWQEFVMSQFFHIFVQQGMSLRILCMFFVVISVEQLLQFLIKQELILKIKQWLVTNVGHVEAIMNGCLRKKMQPFWMPFWMVGQTFDGKIATEGARYFGDMSMFWDRFSFAGELILFCRFIFVGLVDMFLISFVVLCFNKGAHDRLLIDTIH